MKDHFHIDGKIRTKIMTTNHPSKMTLCMDFNPFFSLLDDPCQRLLQAHRVGRLLAEHDGTAQGLDGELVVAEVRVQRGQAQGRVPAKERRRVMADFTGDILHISSYIKTGRVPGEGVKPGRFLSHFYV